MFERYTEPARRALFFARYETSNTGALSIEGEHMLLGLLRAPGPIVGRLLADAGTTSEQLREDVQNRLEFREKVPTSVEIPFSEPTKRILNYTAVEADGLGHSHIGPEHMLLALLRVPEAGAGAILTGHGLRLEAAREVVAAMLAEGVPPTSGRGGAIDARESMARDRAASRPEAAPRVDTVEIVSQIDRMQQPAEQIVMRISSPKEATEMLHLLHVELSALRDRFSEDR